MHNCQKNYKFYYFKRHRLRQHVLLYGQIRYTNFPQYVFKQVQLFRIVDVVTGVMIPHGMQTSLCGICAKSGQKPFGKFDFFFHATVNLYSSASRVATVLRNLSLFFFNKTSGYSLMLYMIW